MDMKTSIVPVGMALAGFGLLVGVGYLGSLVIRKAGGAEEKPKQEICCDQSCECGCQEEKPCTCGKERPARENECVCECPEGEKCVCCQECEDSKVDQCSAGCCPNGDSGEKVDE